MAETSKNFSQAFMEEYARSISAGERAIPPQLEGQVSATGAFDANSVRSATSIWPGYSTSINRGTRCLMS